MCRPIIKFCIFLLVLILKLDTSASIINRSPYESARHQSSHTGSVYLNRAHPLWILKDRAPNEPIERLSHNTARPYYYYDRNRRNRQISNSQINLTTDTRRRFQLPQRIKLPNHYVLKKNQFQTNVTHVVRDTAMNRRRQHNETPRLLSMPTFDGMPGGEEYLNNDHNNDDKMVFIYNGPKGELILNTMLSAHKYPMHEPVPGQILYPPSAPIFRPKPIVERFRVSETGEMMNLTLIPFYAHEAINPRSMNDAENNYNLASTTTSTTTEAPATVMYAKPFAMPTAPTKKPRRYKKAKQYSVYRTPDEVQWRPLASNDISMQLATPPTITTPYTVPTSQVPLLQNHRYGSDSKESAPIANFELSYKDAENQFQIVYADENLEKPNTLVDTSTPMPMQSSSYALTREYYAFPVFTLGKLLQPDVEKRVKYASDMTGVSSNAVSSSSTSTFPTATSFSSLYFPSPSSSSLLDSRTEAENGVTDNFDNTDTWFILNSRYKGHHKHNDQYQLSSKYIQNAAHPDTATTKMTTTKLHGYQHNNFVA